MANGQQGKCGVQRRGRRVFADALFTLAFCVGVGVCSSAAGIMSAAHAQERMSASRPKMILVQDRREDRRETRRRARPRTRIIVRRPQPSARVYPSPAPYDPPGPGYKRHCEGGYVEEMRATGLTVVPRRTCWWQRSGS
jgi:hypothetical protein